MRRIGKLIEIISLLAFLLFPCLLFAATFSPDELYDAPGFDPNRETFSSMPNEHIDTFTGGLILTFEDIRLPGNGGLDLVIQRIGNWRWVVVFERVLVL